MGSDGPNCSKEEADLQLTQWDWREHNREHSELSEVGNLFGDRTNSYRSFLIVYGIRRSRIQEQTLPSVIAYCYMDDRVCRAN